MQKKKWMRNIIPYALCATVPLKARKRKNQKMKTPETKKEKAMPPYEKDEKEENATTAKIYRSGYKFVQPHSISSGP